MTHTSLWGSNEHEHRDCPFSYLTSLQEDLVAWKHLLVAISYKNISCERFLPHTELTPARSPEAVPLYRGHRHKLYPRGCRSSWQWPQPLLLQTAHFYPSPCWSEYKGWVNSVALASPLFSLTTIEEENRVANSELVPAGGWDSTYLTADPTSGLWHLEAWLGGCCSAAWLVVKWEPI